MAASLFDSAAQELPQNYYSGESVYYSKNLLTLSCHEIFINRNERQKNQEKLHLLNTCLSDASNCLLNIALSQT